VPDQEDSHNNSFMVSLTNVN